MILIGLLLLHSQTFILVTILVLACILGITSVILHFSDLILILTASILADAMRQILLMTTASTLGVFYVILRVIATEIFGLLVRQICGPLVKSTVIATTPLHRSTTTHAPGTPCIDSMIPFRA